VKLGEKSIFNIFAVLARFFKSARIAGIMRGNPCELERTHKPTNKARSRRKPYSAGDVELLTTDQRIRPDARMWIALAFYTGMREGEVCGRRFKDYDRDPEPLGAMTVETQYDGEFLKTSTVVRGEKPRVIPVHPALAAALDAWWSEGFEFVFCRKPTPDDFIVPCRARKLRNHTRSSAYKMFITACKLVGIEPHTLHATRNTFISLCRRARCDVAALERVTHNASGDVIDVYTDYDWEPLCDAVETFMTTPPTRPKVRPPLRVVASAGQPVQDVRPAKAQVGTSAPKHR
jgi:integrase